jgi:DNA-binding CsgD family transcriptional regulator
MTSALRNSGIPYIDDVPWGSHLGLFYETHDDLMDAVARYFESGLENNELCVWLLPDGLSAAAAAARLGIEIAGFDDHLTAGRMRLIVRSGELFELDFAAFWEGLLTEVPTLGYDGLRASGDAGPLGQRHDIDSAPDEHAIPSFLAGRPVLTLCTYGLTESRGIDVLDIARVHHVAVARRRGEWQLFEALPLRDPAATEGQVLPAGAAALPGQDQLTERERAVLTLLLRGGSSKEVARELGISPRTAEFHRANIIAKLGARNTTDLVRRVFRGR